MRSVHAAWGSVAVLATVVGVGLGAATQTGPSVPTPPVLTPAAEAKDAGSSGCGVERFAVKHLTDGFAVPSTPTVQSPEHLTGLPAPPVKQDSARITSWDSRWGPEPAGFTPETAYYELQSVHVIAFKPEADSDYHVIVSTPTGAEMNVEAPAAGCNGASPYAAQMDAARTAMDAAFPRGGSGYTPLNLTATISGVVFFDVLHGQRGAPNGVELHPVLCFKVGGGSCSAPLPPPGPPGPPPPSSPPPSPVPTSSTTTTTPTSPTTTGTVTTTPSPPSYDPRWPGCRRYPHRIYYHHRAHRSCRRGWFTTP